MEDKDLSRFLRRIWQAKLSRRGFLYSTGLLAGGAAAGACGSDDESPGGGGGDGGGADAQDGADAQAGDGGGDTSSATIESELRMYNWVDYVNPASIDSFKNRFGVETFTYDTYSSNEELLARLQEGADYDIAVPAANFVPGMVEQGYLARLDLSRLPNLSSIGANFKGQWWDPTNEYSVPKAFGTVGIVYRGKLVVEPPTSWQTFYDLIKSPEHSGKVVFVDSPGEVFAFPLKLLGYSLSSVVSSELEEARQILLDVAPHILALDSDTYADRLASEEASMALGWAGPLAWLTGEPETADSAYVIPSEGSAFWVDVWVMLANAPDPNAAYAWLNFIHEPAIQAAEAEWIGYATPNDAARELVSQEQLDNPAVYPPAELMANLESPQDTSSNTQRIDIWEEFKSLIGT